MCCCNCSCFYKSRIALLAFLLFGDGFFLLVRSVIFISVPVPKVNHTTLVIDNATYNTAFLLDCISSIPVVLVALVIFLILIIIAIVISSLCFVCICLLCYMSLKEKLGSSCISIKSFEVFLRFISLDCKFPCYRARPQLRFAVRTITTLIYLGLRSAALYLYWSMSGKDPRALINFYLCALSFAFLSGKFLLDLYHYAVWWCYTPQIDTRCHCRSRKHVRYIPYHITGEARNKGILGDSPCTSDPCNNRQLSHVVVFHGKDYKPQPRWSMLQRNGGNANYIGFHTTDPLAAVSIAHSEFKLSSKGMLGKGVYFARSIEDTVGKAHNYGACIIAEIQMDRVFEFNKESVYPNNNNPQYDRNLHDFVHSSEWHINYDTCYMNHSDDARDEFCIKDPEKQIVKWIVVIDKEYDSKVARYGLDQEFNDAVCGFI